MNLYEKFWEYPRYLREETAWWHSAEVYSDVEPCWLLHAEHVPGIEEDRYAHLQIDRDPWSFLRSLKELPHIMQWRLRNDPV